MLQGKKFEPEVRAWYEDLTGVDAPPLCCEHDEHPWLRASLDGWVQGAGVCVEIKYARREWHLEALDGKLPHAYEPQCDHQLLATGAKRLHYVSFNPRFPAGQERALVPVQRNTRRCNKLLKAEREFWKHVTSRTPPSSS
jgi:predicted phage-related endonuclease